MIDSIIQQAREAREDMEGMDIPFGVEVRIPNPEALDEATLNELMILIEVALTRTCLEIRDQSHNLVDAGVDIPQWANKL